MRTTESLLGAAVLKQILGSGLTALPPSPMPEVTPTPDSDIYKAELAKTKADAEKNSRFLKGLYESLKLGDISETEYRELKSTYELRVTSLAEQENALKVKIQDSIQREKALEQARNSTLSVKTVADLTKEVVAQTVDKIIVYEKTNIVVDMRCFEADAVSGKEDAING
jgi:hypothetical protein